MRDDRTPVIVGIGEITDRPPDPSLGLEPLALMETALCRAAEDAVGHAKARRLLATIDSIDMVNLASWRYDNPARQLCSRLGILPRRAEYGPLGGESPVRLLHEAALAIARGEQHFCAIVGGEARNSLVKAREKGAELPWTPLSQSERRQQPVASLEFDPGDRNPVVASGFELIRPFSGKRIAFCNRQPREIDCSLEGAIEPALCRTAAVGRKAAET